MTFIVKIADNFNYQDGSFKKGEYDTYDEALKVCKNIVDRSLRDEYKPGMDADTLYSRYKMFGDDAYIVPQDDSAPFSAWDYARARCFEICYGRKPDFGQ